LTRGPWDHMLSSDSDSVIAPVAGFDGETEAFDRDSHSNTIHGPPYAPGARVASLVAACNRVRIAQSIPEQPSEHSAMSGWATIVMAAGTGSRMHSRIPKVLHEVAGRTMLRCVLDAAGAAGPSTRIVVVSPTSAGIRDEAGSETTIAVQEVVNGTAGAVLAAQIAALDADHVLVLNGDLPLIEPRTLRALRERHEETRSVMSLLTALAPEPGGLARILRGVNGDPVEIIEERDAPPELHDTAEINTGVYCFDAGWLWSHLAQVEPSPVTGELYLTALLRMAATGGERITALNADFDEARGVNSRAELATAAQLARSRICRRLLDDGATLIDPQTVYADFGTRVGADTVIHPNTTLQGNTVIGEACEIGPNTIIRSSRVGDRCRVVASVIEEADVEDDVAIGPFSHLRPGASIGHGAQLGNYAEVKQSRIGPNTQMHHFSYIGDATIGDRVNIGAGTITCNYDGQAKHETHIGAGAFIGSDTMLVAPVSVGDGGRTGAGSVVTRNVPAGALVVGVPARPFRQAESRPAEDTASS
jgi:bifunctional UDP-N-acetylglucosamine pyrophosphorylase/glucosamine-1-phosphate N-acetyltransferase